MENNTQAPTWGVWGTTSSTSLSSPAATNTNQNFHRRGASLPSTFLEKKTENEDEESDNVPATVSAPRLRLGHRSSLMRYESNESLVDLDAILSAPALVNNSTNSSESHPQHRRVGSNPLVESKFGPSLLATAASHSHRRSVTFDPLDFSYMNSILPEVAAAVVANNVSPPRSPVPTSMHYSVAAPHSPVVVSNKMPSNESALQAQLAMQQQLIAQQQQWLLMMQQQQQQQHQQQHHQQQQYFPNKFVAMPTSPSPLRHQQHVAAARQNPGVTPPYNEVLQVYKQTGERPCVDDLVGNVLCSFALDAHGSRFLQYQMEISSDKDKDQLALASKPFLILLSKDTFGNYVMQNFLLHASLRVKEELALEMKSHMLELSLDPHGCRVLQRMLDLVSIPVRNDLLMELIVGGRSNVFTAARNTHGTHVLQKTVSLLRRDGPLESSSVRLLRLMESQISLDIIALLQHPYSYRLVLNILGDCNRDGKEHVSKALDTILSHQLQLAKDQHGNFILQQLLDVPKESHFVLDFCLKHVFELSKHKFASHLVEKCFLVGSNDVCVKFAQELLHPTNSEHSSVLDLMMDPYGNFIVQKVFDRLNNANVGQELKMELVSLVHANADVLGKYTYGRHILGHVSAVSGHPLVAQPPPSFHPQQRILNPLYSNPPPNPHVNHHHQHQQHRGKAFQQYRG